VETTEHNAEDVPSASTSSTTALEGIHSNLLAYDVPNPTLELFLDPLLHPDKVDCMIEFGRRFLDYTQVCSRTS
jgi:hypothetical protein